MKYPANCKYALLVTSLPAHKQDLFDEKQTPLSRLQLDKRLALLDEKDTESLSKIESLLHWSQIKQDIDFDEIKETLSSIEYIDNQFINNMIIWRLELRLILVALRMRNKGLKQAPNESVFKLNRWQDYISHNWHQVDFGIGLQLPWVEQANQLLISQQSLALEKLLLKLIWRQYQRQSLGHYFDFEAVIIYVLKWNLISRWNKNDKTKAVTRFDQLLEYGLKQ